MDKYYAIHKGVKPGIYNTWFDAKQQVSGFKGAIYKRFILLEDAKYFVEHGKVPDPIKPKPMKFSNMKTFIKATGKSISKSETSNTDFKPYLDQYHKLSNIDRDTTLIIYTDGSTINNGKVNAHGGYGVFFDDPDILPISEQLNSTKITNNVAELQAIIASLIKVKDDTRKKILKSDSEYSVLAITERYKKYEQNNWVTNYGKPISNAELIKKAVKLVQDQNVQVDHIYACHSNPKTIDETGNYLADRLANRLIPMSIFKH